jgi:hypothetical protein
MVFGLHFQPLRHSNRLLALLQVWLKKQDRNKTFTNNKLKLIRQQQDTEHKSNANAIPSTITAEIMRNEKR